MMNKITKFKILVCMSILPFFVDSEEVEKRELFGTVTETYKDWELNYKKIDINKLNSTIEPVMVMPKQIEGQAYISVFCMYGVGIGLSWFPQEGFIGPVGTEGFITIIIDGKETKLSYSAVENTSLYGKPTGLGSNVRDMYQIIEEMKSGNKLLLKYKSYYEKKEYEESLSLLGFKRSFDKMKRFCNL